MDANVLPNVEVQIQEQFSQNEVDQPVLPLRNGQVISTQYYADPKRGEVVGADNVTHVTVNTDDLAETLAGTLTAPSETIIVNITSDVNAIIGGTDAHAGGSGLNVITPEVAAQIQSQLQAAEAIKAAVPVSIHLHNDTGVTPSLSQDDAVSNTMGMGDTPSASDNATVQSEAMDSDSAENVRPGKRVYKKRGGQIGDGSADGEFDSKRQKIYAQRFRDEWLVDPKFADWLVKVPNNPKKARCMKCMCVVQAKKSSLDSHVESEKHKGTNDDDLYEGPGAEPGSETVVIQSDTGDMIIHTAEKADGPADAESKTSDATQGEIDRENLSKTKVSYIEKRRSMRAELEKQTHRAEMKISAWSAEHHIPFRALESLIGVLSESFSDSKIARKLKMKRTKAGCVVYNVIGKDFIESVERSLQQVTELGKTRYSLIMNEIATTGSSDVDTQLAVVVKYFDGSSLLTRLLGLITIQERNAECAFDELSKCITSKGLSLSECIGWTVLSADPCDLMHGQINSLRTRFMEANPSIVSFRCTCHNSALVASHACEVLPSGCEKLVHDVYNFFSRMTKRSAEFGEFQEFVETQPHRLLKPYQTQWLSILQCVTSIVAKWTALLGFMQDQLTVGKNQRAKDILDAMGNPYNKLFFEFLCFVLPKINALNVTLEGTSPTIDKIHDHICLPYKDLLALYMQPSYIQQSPVSHLSPTSEFHMQPLESTYLGTTVLRGLALLNEPPESKGQFVAVCRNFIMTACQQIQQRFPLDDPILTAASMISVKSAKSGKVVSFVSEVMCHFPQILELTSEQEVDNQWRSLVFDEELTTDMEFDVFWEKVMNNTKYASLWFCIKAIMMLPIPNGDSERLFLQIDKARTAEKNRISLDSILKVISAQESIQAAGGSDAFEPTDGMYARFRKDIYKF